MSPCLGTVAVPRVKDQPLETLSLATERKVILIVCRHSTPTHNESMATTTTTHHRSMRGIDSVSGGNGEMRPGVHWYWAITFEYVGNTTTRVQRKRSFFRLHEKGGRYNVVPAHHVAQAYIDEYLEAGGFGDDRKGPLFRTSRIQFHLTFDNRHQTINGFAHINGITIKMNHNAGFRS